MEAFVPIFASDHLSDLPASYSAETGGQLAHSQPTVYRLTQSSERIQCSDSVDTSGPADATANVRHIFPA
jgi:hypothetical protein